MSIESTIRELKNSNLVAECSCGAEFRLSKIIMFDGTKPFPKEALEAKEQLIEELKERKKDLEKQKKLATEKSQITTKSVNIGKQLEKVFPTLKDFKWNLPDCRFLGDPIDLINFNGLSSNKIDSISFIEVKSGNAKMKARQKKIKETIEDEKVSYKVFK